MESGRSSDETALSLAAQKQTQTKQAKRTKQAKLNKTSKAIFCITKQAVTVTVTVTDTVTVTGTVTVSVIVIPQDSTALKRAVLPAPEKRASFRSRSADLWENGDVRRAGAETAACKKYGCHCAGDVV